MENKQLVKEISNSMAIALPDEISAEELHLRLAVYINDLIKNNFQQLIMLLYRIDVSEQKLKQLLKEKAGEDAGKIIAALIIERQLQKIKTRQQFGRRDDNFNEAEKW